MSTKLKAWMMALMAALLVSSVAPLATTQPRGPKHEPRGLKMKGPKAKKVRDRILRNKVGLDEAKADEVARIFVEHETERREIQHELRTAHKTLRELVRADSDDQDAYAAALESLEASSKELQALRDAEFAALKKILTPREQARLLKAMQIVRRRLDARQRGQE